MLSEFDEGLEAFLRAVTPLSAVDIDVSFETPNDEWAAKLTRPTVNVYLWDIRRSSTRAVTGVEHAQRDGVTVRRMALPRLELRYFVSVWTSEHDDERALISALTIALLGHPEISAGFLPDSVMIAPYPQLQLARSTDTDIFRLDGRMKLGLQLQMLVVADIGGGAPLAKPVSELGISLTDRDTGATSQPPRLIAGECLDPGAIGSTVRAPNGVATVNAAGRFLITARPGDTLVLETETARTVVVPPAGGVVFTGTEPIPADTP
ncbi:MAG: Pvc16 family protein [Ilumatobacteraceae bacterium]